VSCLQLVNDMLSIQLPGNVDDIQRIVFHK